MGNINKPDEITRLLRKFDILKTDTIRSVELRLCENRDEIPNIMVNIDRIEEKLRRVVEQTIIDCGNDLIFLRNCVRLPPKTEIKNEQD